MASTFSTNLAIELIGTGDQAGTWGVTTNTNLGTLIEQAISGYVTQAVSTGADTTITIPNGATGVARNMYIELTGTGGTNTNLIVPSNKKLYFIFNNTSSGQVTVKVSGQTGVSVPNGKKMVLVCNGTDVVNGLNYIADFGTNSFTVTNLTASSGTITNLIATTGTITTLSATSGNISNLVSSDASATVLRAGSATLTHLSATSASITNLTLTSLVISNLSIASANITTLTSSSATISTTLALSGGTANGVLYLNGSKVATSGSALTFDGSSFLVGATSAAAGKMVVKDTASSNTLWLIGRTSDGASSVSFRNAADSAYNARLEGVSNQLLFEVGGSEAMRLTSTGLGIGETSPSQRISIKTGAGGCWMSAADSVNVAAPTLIGSDGTGAAAIYTAGAYPIKFYTNTSERMRLDSSGNLGIGTSSPAYKLDVNGTGYIANIRFENPSAFLSNSADALIGWASSFSGYTNGTLILQSRSSTATPIVFATGATTASERMRITDAGDVGIGTSSPSTLLHLSAANPILLLQEADQAANSQRWGIQGESALFKVRAFNDAMSSAVDLLIGDRSGNLGLGVTPSAWGTFIGFDINSSTNPGAISSGGTMALGSNCYYNGANWIYKNSSLAPSLFQQQSGAHQFYTAASGTAGNTISFTQAMTLTEAGNLGVGITSPENVSGYKVIQAQGSTQGGIFQSTTGSYTTKTRLYSTDGGGVVGTASNHALAFLTNDTERARINSDGDVIIGSTVAPVGNGLAVNSGVSSSSVTAIEIQQNTTGAVKAAAAFGVSIQNSGEATNAADLFFSTASGGSLGERARITSGGDFGIGTTSPLSVTGSTYGWRVAQLYGSGDAAFVINGNNGAGRLHLVAGGASANQKSWGIQSFGGSLIFASINDALGETERARITSGGYFKASNDGTYVESTQCHELRTTEDARAVIVTATNASYTSDAVQIRASRNTTNNSFYALTYYNVGATAYKFQVADSGNVTNTNGSYGTISDVKMKTDIVDAGSQWADMKAVRFRKFKMKNDPSGLMQLGVVAQELEQTSPGLVDEHADRDAEGNDLGTTTKSVKTSVLLMKAAVALQEAMARIEQLEADMAALKASA